MKTLKILPFAAAFFVGASSVAIAQTGAGSGGIETPGSEAMSTDAFGQDMTGPGANSETKDRGLPGTGLTGTIANPDSGVGPSGLDISDPPSIMLPPSSSRAR
jgi:hypothetical protein